MKKKKKFDFKGLYRHLVIAYGYCILNRDVNYEEYLQYLALIRPAFEGVVLSDSNLIFENYDLPNEVMNIKVSLQSLPIRICKETSPELYYDTLRQFFTLAAKMPNGSIPVTYNKAELSDSHVVEAMNAVTNSVSVIKKPSFTLRL